MAMKRRRLNEHQREQVRLRFSFAVSLLWFAAVIAMLTARPAQPDVIWQPMIRQVYLD